MQLPPEGRRDPNNVRCGAKHAWRRLAEEIGAHFNNVFTEAQSVRIAAGCGKRVDNVADWVVLASMYLCSALNKASKNKGEPTVVNCLHSTINKQCSAFYSLLLRAVSIFHLVSVGFNPSFTSQQDNAKD
jgi:hypothetical protein